MNTKTETARCAHCGAEVGPDDIHDEDTGLSWCAETCEGYAVEAADSVERDYADDVVRFERH
jgi:hypothetical protein